MAGYSATPLLKKLGWKPGERVLVKGAPGDYLELLACPAESAPRVVSRWGKNLDGVHAFHTKRAALGADLSKARTAIRPDGAVWVSWPKKSAKVPSEVTEDVVRELALPLGLVDVKVCAVNDVWSGLKVVIRKELR